MKSRFTEEQMINILGEASQQTPILQLRLPMQITVMQRLMASKSFLRNRSLVILELHANAAAGINSAKMQRGCNHIRPMR